jgi:hypothetical protein
MKVFLMSCEEVKAEASEVVYDIPLTVMPNLFRHPTGQVAALLSKAA